MMFYEFYMMSPPCQSLSGMGSTQCTSCPHSVLTLPFVLASTCTLNNYTFIIIGTVAVIGLLNGNM